MATVYRGRFAPSPTGPLHQGSLVAALASWLDAKAHFGHWLIRIEDIDYTRCKSEFTSVILSQLNTLGLQSDEPVCQQSHRNPLYQQALDTLVAQAYAYPCGCSRKTIMDTHHGIYPGTCRQGLNDHHHARAWRVFCGEHQQPVHIKWHDRKLGSQYQNLTHEIGDFILRRADGPWAYQLAVVVDDAHQAITHVVRGEDLADNTPRQIYLQSLLGLATPAYLHTPLVLAKDGQKLSKQTGAQALDLSNPLACLNNAMHILELPVPQTPHLHDWLRIATGYWAEKFKL